MLKVHFTDADLAKLTIAESADPMWELLTSLYRLRRPEGEPFFGRWRRETRSAVSAPGRQLMSAVPPYGYCPDFLTPAMPSTTLAEGVAALEETSSRTLRRDIDELAAENPRLPPWLGRLRYGNRRDLRQLGDAVRGYFSGHIAPYWPVLSKAVAQERARLLAALERGGPQLVLSTLHPDMQWRPPVLAVRFPVEQDLHLDGRGLRLIPAFFGHGMPTTYKNTDLPPVLVYSIDHHPMLERGSEPGASLSALLGPTRARVLMAIAGGSCSTSELALLTGISVASASQHASVLRDSGLSCAVRQGRAKSHQVSPLGLAIIRAG
ncbi:ArsR/SmtB family transcription factor [Amycolatopsis sp. H20-H5]|uniref:ArsR/SmtB family transcription factor n=1 Tax=Amycolatopsis sp. H20-H5 TaxID=3046309 RepID=UPI002DBBEB80|nr:winged helix-turn-helix domain-containing protein [Amycolatopsis sp. H20-H5]MEC3978651.1 winged helix-turn-helix domain-containing protein [Amycolatopsis sp. H20-H5]